MAHRTVLMISADAESTVSFHDQFGSAGYEMKFAQSIKEALTIARRDLPQAIVLDSEVPGLDLEALINDLRSAPRTRHIHVTLLVPRAERDARLAALSSGIDEFMTKPVDAEELELRVRNALRRAEFQNLVNPMTGLPGPPLIEERLRELLRSEPDWALLRLTLKNYTTFTDVHGFLAGEEMVRFAGRMFSVIVNQYSTAEDFLGHASDYQFVVITAHVLAEQLRDQLQQRFDEDVKSHYSFREREQGYSVLRNSDGSETQVPLMTLDVRMTSAEDGPFSDIRELATF